jgi:predicted DNA-binding protein
MTSTTPATKQLPLRLPADVYQQLKTMAYFTGRSMNEIVIEALTGFLATSGDTEQAHAMLERARGEYRDVLDKLKHL